MKKKIIIFTFLAFLIILLMSVGIFYYFNGIKKKLTTNEVYEITNLLNTDEYRVFYQEIYDDVRNIDLSLIMDSDVFYDMENFDYDKLYSEENLEDYESRYLTEKISPDELNDYIKKYTNYNISEYKNNIVDTVDEEMNFIHKKMNYDFSLIDCIDGYKIKDKYFLNCYVGSDNKPHILTLSKLENDYIFISNKYEE